GGTANILNKLMHIAGSDNNTALAIFFGKQAVNVHQQLRSNLQSLDKEIHQDYLKFFAETYRTLADLLIVCGPLSEAQQVLNVFKDQQFFDLNPEQSKQPTVLTLTLREASFSDRYKRASIRVATVGQQFEELRRRIGEREPDPEEK